ncbi:MAG TPA: hypothetical protein VFN04_05560 [Protaetiibacter sp.]|nr:hypothetical protein [Protaetiibacter sp.]
MNITTRRPRMVSAAVGVAVLTALTMVGVAGCTALAGGPGADTSAIAEDAHLHGAAASDSKQIGLYSAMSNLWAEHMEWTYATVVAFVEESPALEPTLNRLQQNQKDIGAAIEPFYGADAADQLTALLTEHIQDAVPVLTAAKTGDSAALETAVNAWYANAEEIGRFLAGANPNWPEAGMVEMMRMHITQTVAYATDALTGDYVKAVADYGLAEQHMQQMANDLSAGLVAQFPELFR